MDMFMVWLVCAGLAAAIGQRKNEGFKAFLLGLLLGPFGVVIALVSSGNLRPCPHCRSRIDPKATVCPKCTRDVTPTNAAADLHKTQVAAQAAQKQAQIAARASQQQAQVVAEAARQKAAADLERARIEAAERENIAAQLSHVGVRKGG
jgi:hypothetical protein